MTTTPDAPIRKKLIEVSIPLEDINAESAREKSIRHGHPSTLHLWWARRPLAAARAVLFAQLVDDPSSNPDLTEEQQKAERERLHGIIRRLVKWENINDEALLREAHEEILKSTGGNPPAILDPFAGGGTIPLEAQRLGLEAHASDLNPVAVLINKALIEIPPKFAGRPPVFPGAAETQLGAWPRATGLAEDVRRYGALDARAGQGAHRAPVPRRDDRRREDRQDVDGHDDRVDLGAHCHLPQPGLRHRDAARALVVARQEEGQGGVRRPRPWSTTPTRAAVGASSSRSDMTGRRRPTEDGDGTVGRRWRDAVSHAAARRRPSYIRAKAGPEDSAPDSWRSSPRETGDGSTSRRTPNTSGVAAWTRPSRTPDQNSLDPSHDVDPTPDVRDATMVSTLFTNRQLVALTTFSDLVGEARAKVLEDALAAGLPSGARLADGGTGAEAYADAVATYLGIGVSRVTDRHSSITTWDSGPNEGACPKRLRTSSHPDGVGLRRSEPVRRLSWRLRRSRIGIASGRLDGLPATGLGAAHPG